MAHHRLTATFKLLFKVSLTCIALLIVYRTIDVEKTIELLKSVSYGSVIASLIFYTGSKVVSAYRLNLFFQCEGFSLNSTTNLRLYFQGMFYNLFLPGGIGGDGYKAIFLKRQYGFSVKKVIRALLFDRISGMIALVCLCTLFILLAVSTLSQFVSIIMVITMISIFPVTYLITSLLFPEYTTHFIKSSLYSIGVQGLQLFSAFFILSSMGLQDSYLIYLGIFLVSSVFAIIPFTIGGAGARELAFVLASRFVGIDVDLAIAFSLLFFLINAVSSLPGIFVRLPIQTDRVEEFESLKQNA